MLVAKGANVRTPIKDGSTLMFMAAELGRLDVMDWLYENGAKEDVRTPMNDGVTPMHIATLAGNLEAVKWLYHHGANETVRSKYGTALELARLQGDTHAKIAKFLENLPKRQIEGEVERTGATFQKR